ncbi:MAG: UDP-N-acetylglucosamine 2-epimerase (non-hydrolyzing) [Betaproteobacteria bacterium]|nr:UDP-N-acetylglucosamine 2-epimerase (non-hydrolyzing) [Betaproteobacteria bacterium]
MKITTVVGARPQFIKAAPVSRALAAVGVAEAILHTGQHFDAGMSDVFFRELEIAAPARHLGIGGLPHGAMTGRMLEGIEQALLEDRPDCVLVYGDTDSTLAGALAAVKLNISVAHVEAGLRSFNLAMPEEVNRRVADHVSSLLFAPTEAAVENLRREGLMDGVHRVGDVMYDAALLVANSARARSTVLSRLGLRAGGYVLATVHRAENTDNAARLRIIIGALGELAREIPLVLPLHPRTRKIMTSLGLAIPPGIRAIEPVGFLDMVMLEQSARLIATDSGGVQKEAYFHGVPCVTLREETEWVELVEIGANRLAAPVSVAAVRAALFAALETPRPQPEVHRFYGDGHAAGRIAGILAARAH